MDFDNARPSVGGNNSQKLEELFELLKLNNKWVQLRILPKTEANENPMISLKQHWIDIIGSKSRKEVRIPKMCVGHDSLTDQTGDCPYCDLGNNPTHFYLVNVLVRSLQEDAPAKQRRTAEEKKSGFKEVGSDSWTPIRVLRVPSSLMLKIQGLKDLNKHSIKGEKKAFNVNHVKFGADIMLKHDKNAKGSDQYQVQLADKGALTEEELGYLVWRLDDSVAAAMGQETVAAAKKEIGKMEFAGDYDVGGDSDEDDDDDADMGKKKKSAAGKSKSKAKGKASSDYDDEDDDDEEDEAPRGKSKSKPAPKGKKRPADDEDDEDDDFDMGDDDEEDEAPRGKSKAKPAPKGKKRPADDEDEDDDDEYDDDDNEDDDDEDDAPRGKSKAKSKPAPKGKKRPVDEDDYDDEDDDEDDDEEDEAPRGKSKSKPAPKGKSKGRSDEDDDELDDDEDDEDDDEDEDDEPPRKSKAKAKPAPKGKKRPADDDDDDDIPF